MYVLVEMNGNGNMINRNLEGMAKSGLPTAQNVPIKPQFAWIIKKKEKKILTHKIKTEKL